MEKTFKPTFLDRAISAIAPTAGMRRIAARYALHNFAYDGARASNQRAQAPHQIAPNSYAVQRDRLQLMREAIDLENNFAPAKSINRKYAMYVAPQAYNAQTGDPKLDADVEEYLNNDFFKNCDATGRYNFWTMLEFGVMGMNRGGDYGWVFQRSENDDLRIQAIEADRLGGVYQNTVTEDYCAGVLIGPDGRPTHYRIFKRAMGIDQYVDPVDVPAIQFVHYLDPMQIDSYRGISKLDTGSANLRDLYEIITFIKGKTKLASALTLFTNSNGASIGPGALDPYQDTTSAAQAIMAQDISYGQINHIPAGGDMKFPDSQSPGPETQYLMTLLQKFVCMSYNLPFSFALDAAALGGVSARLESEQAKAEFERGQKIISPHAHRIKDMALLDAVGKKTFPASTLSRICKGRFGFRSHPQPDIGKEASAAVSLYQNGMLNPVKFWQDDAQDPETVAKEMVRWAGIKAKAVEGTNFTVEEVFGTGPSMPKNVTESTDPNQQSNENGAPPI